MKESQNNMSEGAASGADASRWYAVEGGYFQLPRALRYDDRLSHSQRVVLVTIASHVILVDEVHPSRQTIRAYTGIDAADISAHTGALEAAGWLSKSHEDGQVVHYRLNVPAYAIERMRSVSGEARRLREAARVKRLEVQAQRLRDKEDRPCGRSGPRLY